MRIKREENVDHEAPPRQNKERGPPVSVGNFAPGAGAVIGWLCSWMGKFAERPKKQKSARGFQQSL